MDLPEHDVIVVGAGNAATCAALSAKEEGGDAKFPQNREFFAIYQGILGHDGYMFMKCAQNKTLGAAPAVPASASNQLG